MPQHAIYTGCAGWSIPGAQAGRFPATGSHLERYARRLPAVEINSSFYRLHKPATYRRWAEAVPAHFRFAVKLPKAITHQAWLKRWDVLDAFLAGISELGAKSGPVLVQLPPGLTFAADTASAFFAAFRTQFAGDIVCEPRHPSWFERDAEKLLESFRIARVAADPAPVPAAAFPGAWQQLIYYRLHGSPRRYYSEYPESFLARLCDRLRQAAQWAPVWCIFNNTAAGAAIGNALWLLARLAEE